MASESVELEGLISDVCSDSRRRRQAACATLSVNYGNQPEVLLPYGNVILSLLDLSDARTRWNALDILALLVPYDVDLCVRALPGAEDALFEESSGFLHLAAMRFLCQLGAASPQLSEQVWPLLDEGIQCYHGDQEFPDMLNALVAFSACEMTDSVREQFEARMNFDALNNRGIVKRKAQTIIDNLRK